MNYTENLDYLRELIYSGDDRACYVEREEYLDSVPEGTPQVDIIEKIVHILTPQIDDKDVFLGRQLEAVREQNKSNYSTKLWNLGHMSPNYKMLLEKGFEGILESIPDKDSELYKNGVRVANAIKVFAERYSKACSNINSPYIKRAAEALKVVPFKPAYDYFSALHSIWFVHFFMSTVTGHRDYAFGRMDQYMYPYLKADIEKGVITREEAVDIFAHFCMKCNEITSLRSPDDWTKPIPCFSTKEYICLGGCDKDGKPFSNEMSLVMLEGASKACMAQPVLTVLYNYDSPDKKFNDAVFKALTVLKDKMQVYNDKIMPQMLIKKGVPEELAYDYTYSACTNLDLHYRTDRVENYTNNPKILLDVLFGKDYSSVDEIVEDYKEATKTYYEKVVKGLNDGWVPSHGDKGNHSITGLLMGDDVARSAYQYYGGFDYITANFYIQGIATMGDSLAAIDKLCFKDKRMSYHDFMEIVKNNFKGHEELQAELKNKFPKYGNDTEADDYAVQIANATLDAFDELNLDKYNFSLKEGHKNKLIIIPGFYSLVHHNRMCVETPATPDGREAGVAFSENQSPVYGCDREGLTSLLKSMAKLPFDRCGCGGANISLSFMPQKDILKAIYEAYFKEGGFHLGTSIINRETIEDAMKNPDKYKTLTVRLYGFSDYFINLAEFQKIEILNRTINSVR